MTQIFRGALQSLLGLYNSLKAEFLAAGGAAMVGFQQSGVGAVARTLEGKAREVRSVFDWMTAAQQADVVSGAPVLDHSAALQAALDSGYSLAWPQGQYNAHGLVQNTAYQVCWALGRVVLVKNANGPILTIGAGASDVEWRGVTFRGDAAAPVFTGDNVVCNGVSPRFINCGSMWAAGRALKATKDQVQVWGSNPIWHTADAAGYDVEIGVAGTATLYHELHGVRTSQAGGGILLTDTGSHTIVGGQFGKLSIKAGTKPAGVNGGKTVGARILGTVLVEQSNAGFSLNQFSAVNFTFALGTAQCVLDASNVFGVGAVVTNSGNANNRIEREVSAGAVMQKKFGDDTSTAVMTVDTTDPAVQFQWSGSQVVPNARGYRGKTAAGTVFDMAVCTAGDALILGSNTPVRVDLGGQFVNIASAAGTQVQVVDGAMRPYADNVKALGTASLRWSQLFAGTATISTSDAREKQQVRTIGAQERAVAVRIKGMLRAFKFNDAVSDKGEGARWHFGVIAQEVRDAFAAEGLDAERYALLCFDEWPETPAVPELLDTEGNVVQKAEPARPAGNRWGVRYEELLAFVLAAI